MRQAGREGGRLCCCVGVTDRQPRPKFMHRHLWKLLHLPVLPLSTVGIIAVFINLLYTMEGVLFLNSSTRTNYKKSASLRSLTVMKMRCSNCTIKYTKVSYIFSSTSANDGDIMHTILPHLKQGINFLELLMDMRINNGDLPP